MGIEPTSVGATIRCVNHFATTAMLFFANISLPTKARKVKQYSFRRGKQKQKAIFPRNRENRFGLDLFGDHGDAKSGISQMNEEHGTDIAGAMDDRVWIHRRDGFE
jgi:hypothetical protein